MSIGKKMVISKYRLEDLITRDFTFDEKDGRYYKQVTANSQIVVNSWNGLTYVKSNCIFIDPELLEEIHELARDYWLEFKDIEPNNEENEKEEE